MKTKPRHSDSTLTAPEALEVGVGGTYVHVMLKLVVVALPPYTPTSAYTVVEVTGEMVSSDAVPHALSSLPPWHWN